MFGDATALSLLSLLIKEGNKNMAIMAKIITTTIVSLPFRSFLFRFGLVIFFFMSLVNLFHLIFAF
jgi:hypothetical protein